MDRRPQARGEDEVAAVDRRGDSPGRLARAGGERHQGRVALEVRRRARGGGREVDPSPPVEAVPGQTVGEDLIDFQSFSISAAISAAAFFASSNSIDVLSR